MNTNSPIISGADNHSDHERLHQPPRRLEIYGTGNRIRLEKSADLSGFSIIIRGNNNLITIGQNTRLRGLVYVLGNKSSLRVESDTTTETVRFSVGARATIHVGKDCMLSRNIEIRCSDEHPIYDLDTKEEINAGRTVTIGDHVWIGEGARVLKGVSIASGCVIGTGSLVTKSLNEPNTIYAGTPARKIRSRIAWSRNPSSMDWTKADYTLTQRLSVEDAQF